jgi:hypothetical protein
MNLQSVRRNAIAVPPIVSQDVADVADMADRLSASALRELDNG